MPWPWAQLQEAERCDATKLGKWIQQVLDPPLDTKNIQKIVEAEIDGRVPRRCCWTSLCVLASIY
jgi:hypothetical protein